MRYAFYVAVLGLIMGATFGCGGSTPESGAVADSGGQAAPVAGAGAGAAPASPMADAGSGESAQAGAEAGTGDASGTGGSGSPNPGSNGYPGPSGSGSPNPGAGGEDAAGAAPLGGGVGVEGVGGPGYPGVGGPGYPGVGGPGYPGAADGAAGGSGTIGLPGEGYPGAGGGVGAAGTLGAAGGDGTAPPPPATFDGFAKQAFAQGREREAIQFLQAWALTSDAGAAEVLSNIQWVSALKRPTMAVRWGIGIQLNAPRGFTGDAKPIGSQQAFTAGRAGRGDSNPSAGGPGAGGGFGLGGAEGGGAAGDGGAIGQYAGEFGTMILTKFQSLVSSGKFGKALSEAPSAAGADGSGSYAAGGPGLAGSGGGGLALDGAGAGYRSGGMRPGMRGGGDGAGGASIPEGSITTGLTLLGVGSEKELKEKARDAKIDVLAVFRIKLTVNRAGFIDNDCEIVLFDPAKEKAEFYKSVALNNIKVQKDREQNKDDGVEKAVDKLFDYIEKNLTVTAMPAVVTNAVVKSSRVEKQLLAGPIDDPLSVLTEIRFYHRNKLLADEDALAAMAKVAGGDANAKTLLQGKEEDKKKVVEKWLPKG